MDFLFDRAASALCTPAFINTVDDDRTAFLSESIWNALHLFPSPGKSYAAVCIAPTSGSVRKDNSLICWGALDTHSRGLTVSNTWLRQYPTVFPHNHEQRVGDEPTHTVSAAQVSPLSEVILEAPSSDAFAFATTNQSLLEDWFFDEHIILREGRLYSFQATGVDSTVGGGTICDRYWFRILLAAPVMQGYAQRQVTRFYVTSPPASGKFLSDLDPYGSPESAESFNGTDAEDYVEIDEAFLMGSTLHDTSSSLDHDKSDHYPNAGDNDTNFDPLKIKRLGWFCTANMLLEPLSPEWDDCTIYVRTSDLSRIGVLNGDWAIVRDAQGSSRRLVRTCVIDSQISGAAWMSPQLLHNITAGKDYLGDANLWLHSSPFGSHQPAIPTARNMTIARVASPFSTDRAYQPLFLRALQSYFMKARRLIKQGDIIAVMINTDDGRKHGDLDSETGEPQEGAETDETTATHLSSANEPVHFMVTNVEYNVLPSKEELSMYDEYSSSTVGEFGCWVDPTATRLTQAGVEHSRVPYAASYFRVGEKSSAFNLDKSSLTLSQLSTASKRLLALASAALNPHSVDYQLQLAILLKGSRSVGKYTTALWVSQRLGLHLYEVNCYDILDDNDTKTEGILRARFEKASSLSPCILLLRNIDAFSQTTQGSDLDNGAIAGVLQDCMNTVQQAWSLTGFPVIVVATTSNSDRVPSHILSYFKHEITLEAPGEKERHDILTTLSRQYNLASDVSIKDLAIQTAALVAGDLRDLVQRARRASIIRTMQHIDQGTTGLPTADIPIIAADFALALSDSRALYSENIGAPKIPAVSWDDVGGLAHVKADILDTIQLPLEHPELFADGLKKRSGILLYGPPGTGKTLLAKAVATSCALNFFSVKGPELLNMYIGESEANVRRVFQRARDARPCVIFFDELDSVAPKRGNHGDSGGVMDRIVSQLLAELDGLSGGNSGADVFVIGATNRPDLLDSALLRPGRFDRMLYLGVSTTHEAQLNILQALTRKFRLHPDLELATVAEQCPFHYTGADFYALCADALLKAMSRKAEEIETKIAELNRSPEDTRFPHPLTPQYYLAVLATPDEMQVLVTQEDFNAALNQLVPSVSQAEMEHYARIQQRFSSETINTS